MPTLLTSLSKASPFALTYSKKKIIMLFFLLTAGFRILLFFLILSPLVLSTVFALNLSLLFLIMIPMAPFVLNILEISLLANILPKSFLTFFILETNLKLLLWFLVLVLLVKLGILLLMIILLVPLETILTALALLNVFLNLKKLIGFRLESTNTQLIEHFISLFTVMCVALVWLTIIGVDYTKNKHHYHLKIRDTKKFKNGSVSRLYSLFNLGLTIFNKCYDSSVNFVLKFDFVLYDI